MVLTRARLAQALLDVGREVTDEDASLFAAINPSAPDSGFQITMLIRARFDRPGPPPQVTRVRTALYEVRGW